MNRFIKAKLALPNRGALIAGCCLGMFFATTALTAAAAPNNTAENVSLHSTQPQTSDEIEHLDILEHASHAERLCNTPGYQRSQEYYEAPDIELVDASGKEIRLAQLLETDRPIILNFIFTSCTTVCPILTATLSQASKAFADDETPPLLLSISIDPQHDTPPRLQEYAARNHAGDNWLFLTGDQDKVLSLQRAFDAYFGTKMNHQPVTFLRRAHDQPWVRLQGFTSAASLVTEYRALFSHPG